MIDFDKFKKSLRRLALQFAILGASVSRTQITYAAIAAIFIIALAFYYWNPGSEAIQFLAGIPLVGSLVAALVQILRDQTAHERAMLILAEQNRFALGASSHMASVAFDKHVQFSEEYAKEVHKALTTLFREGPTPAVLRHTDALYALQKKYAVWLTSKLEKDLETFESALRRIGANASYVYDTSNAENSEHRQQKLDAMYQKFAQVMGFEEWQGEELTDELAVSMMIRRLRTILGTEELTKMRIAIVSKAIAELQTNG